MKICKTIEEAVQWSDTVRSAGEKLGVVPTMGALHQGHLSLVHASQEHCDRTAVTIFVNPTQFAPEEDLDTYPRPLEEDLEQLASLGVDMVFTPTTGEIYPEGYNTWVNVLGVTEQLCGASRPTHFRGVTTVVCKLLNILNPASAFFGLKDFQQTVVIRKMVRDLNMRVRIHCCPIVREKDGLAMSSRNKYLSAEQRSQALCLSRALEEAEKQIRSGYPVGKVLETVKKTISASPLARTDYAEIRHPETLSPVDSFKDGAIIALAVFFGNTRLIDNLLYLPEE